ncbi:MAG: (Fe-S)-binding protein [Erysipelotrichaceae bacterium]
MADKFLKVEIDERVEKVTELLPGYNCGGCGYAGCSGLAQALVDGEVDTVSMCKPSKPEAKVTISNYLNTTPDANGVCLKVKP